MCAMTQVEGKRPLARWISNSGSARGFGRVKAFTMLGLIEMLVFGMVIEDRLERIPKT